MADQGDRTDHLRDPRAERSAVFGRSFSLPRTNPKLCGTGEKAVVAQRAVERLREQDLDMRGKLQAPLTFGRRPFDKAATGIFDHRTRYTRIISLTM